MFASDQRNSNLFLKNKGKGGKGKVLKLHCFLMNLTQLFIKFLFFIKGSE